MAGDIEAFLKMAAERRRQAQAAQGQGNQQPGNPGAPVTTGQAGAASGGGSAGQPNRYRGQASGASGSGQGRGKGGSGTSQRGGQPTESDRKPLRSTLADESSMLNPVGREEIPLDPYAQMDDLPDRPKTNQGKSKAKSGQTTSRPDASRLKPTVSPKVAPSVAPSIRTHAESTDSSRSGKDTAGIGVEIARMLQNPASIPASFVLSEILRPRDFDRDDWD